MSFRHAKTASNKGSSRATRPLIACLIFGRFHQGDLEPPARCCAGYGTRSLEYAEHNRAIIKTEWHYSWLLYISVLEYAFRVQSTQFCVRFEAFFLYIIFKQENLIILIGMGCRPCREQVSRGKKRVIPNRTVKPGAPPRFTARLMFVPLPPPAVGPLPDAGGALNASVPSVPSGRKGRRFSL